MDNSSFRFEERKEIGGGKANRLRRNGYVPAVVYGRGMEPVPVKVKVSDFREFLTKRGKNSVFATEFAAENDFSALLRDVQYDPVTKDVIHADFQKVSLTNKMHAKVPVKLIGRERIEREGNVVVHQFDEVTVECLPQDVPKYISADITGMTPGRSLTAAQLKLPDGVVLVNSPKDVILSVTGGKRDLEVDKVDEPVVPEGEEGYVKAKPVH